MSNETGPKHLVHKMTRSKLESLVADLISRTIAPCEKCLKDSNLTKDKVSRRRKYIAIL